MEVMLHCTQAAKFLRTGPDLPEGPIQDKSLFPRMLRKLCPAKFGGNYELCEEVVNFPQRTRFFRRGTDVWVAAEGKCGKDEAGLCWLALPLNVNRFAFLTECRAGGGVPLRLTKARLRRAQGCDPR